MIERIHVEGLHVQAHVGVSDDERGQAQTLVFNVTVVPDIPELCDDLAAAVDYTAIARITTEVVNRSRSKLIETLAETVATELLAQFKLRRATVEVRKFVLPHTQYVAVTAVREAKSLTRE